MVRCPNCGEEIEMIQESNNTNPTYWCPKCGCLLTYGVDIL